MKYSAAILLLLATPAFAHHEAVVATLAPTLMLWALAGVGGGLAVWRAWRAKRK